MTQAADARSTGSPVSFDEKKKGVGNSYLTDVRVLRDQLERSRTPDVSTVFSDGGAGCSSLISAGSLAGTAVEDRLKRRAAKTQHLAAGLVLRMESIEHSIFEVTQCITRLQRTRGICFASLGIAEKRLAIREKRPREENIRDNLELTLEDECLCLTDARELLAKHIEAAQEILATLDEYRSEMLQRRLTFHLDRSNRANDFLEATREIEGSGSAVCGKCIAAISKLERKVSQARTKTNASIKRRIAETQARRKELEQEIKATHVAIASAERDYRTMQRQVQNYYDAPERALEDDAEQPSLHREAGRNQPDLGGDGPLAKLRAKIKGAAYSGPAGRQLDVLFGRIDRDGSGELDEDEVRVALRRCLKIPPSVVSDPEVSVLCNLLDADHSGTVSIKEMLRFLSADTDVCALEDQCKTTLELLDQLKAAEKQMVDDLRCKTAAWKIDESCRWVTVAKGLELDGVAPSAGSRQATPNGMRKRRLPLTPEVLDTIRARIKAAAYTGHSGRQLGTVFSRFDKDGSGELDEEEVRRTLRRSLRIPIEVISDEAIYSFCAMLDANDSGTVSIDEIVGFVGVEPESSKRTGRACKSPRYAQGSPRNVRGASLSADVLGMMRAKMKASSYAGTGGRSVELLFSRFDKDGSGQLEADEFRKALRRVLRIPPEVISDGDISALCAMLDRDGSGSVGVNDIVAFIG